MSTRLHLFLIIIIGLIIAWFDYFIYLGWQWIFKYNYYCIESFNGDGQKICQIWFDLNPLPTLILTIAAIVITVWYIFKIFTLFLQYFGVVKS